MLDQNGTRKEQRVCHMATQIENMVLSKVLKSFGVLPKKFDQEFQVESMWCLWRASGSKMTASRHKMRSGRRHRGTR